MKLETIKGFDKGFFVFSYQYYMDPYNAVSSLFFNWSNGEIIDEGEAYIYRNCVLTVDIPTSNGIIQAGTPINEIHYVLEDSLYILYEDPTQDIVIGLFPTGSHIFLSTLAQAIERRFNAGGAAGNAQGSAKRSKRM